MLSDLFGQNPNALTYKQIVKGKDGDISKLTKLASKVGTTGVLSMITARFFSNPSKITCFESVRSLVQDWSNSIQLHDEETEKQLKAIQSARLKATIEHLRRAYKETEREIIVTSLDS